MLQALIEGRKEKKEREEEKLLRVELKMFLLPVFVLDQLAHMWV